MLKHLTAAGEMNGLRGKPETGSAWFRTSSRNVLVCQGQKSTKIRDLEDGGLVRETRIRRTRKGGKVARV